MPAWALPLSVLALAFLLPGNAAADDDTPTVAKDSVQVTAFTFNVFHKDFDRWSWVPRMAFRVNGPIASGSQLYAEFTIPGVGPWVKFDCSTADTPKGHSWKTECGARDVSEDKSSTYTGTVRFAIHVRNELAGTDSTLFSGRIKVAKVHTNEGGPKAVNKFVYYVDYDWDLPIAYAYLTPDDLRGWDRSGVGFAFWVRGDPDDFQPHLFYQGQEVGKKFMGADEVGKAFCEGDVDNGPSLSIEDNFPQKAEWSRIKCGFPNIKGWDKTGEAPGVFGPLYLLSANPGEYELKVLRRHHLARSIKITVGPDGKFDNGVATANHLGSNRVIVPVQILGDQDGQWDRGAWKTEAFYGNPLTGFTPLP